VCQVCCISDKNCNIRVAHVIMSPLLSSAKPNFATATDIFRLRPNFSLNLAKNTCLELATLIDVNNNKYSPVLGQSYTPFYFRSSLRPYTKIEKFDTKTNFSKQKNPLLMCRNVRSIEWHQKTYHEISWYYPFNDKRYRIHYRYKTNSPRHLVTF
jgi:hypothetical protein